MLLQEESDVTASLDMVSAPAKPSWDTDLALFDQRMDETGFVRSPSQPMTCPDGNCAIYAILDQINRDQTQDPMYDMDEPDMLRQCKYTIQ